LTFDNVADLLAVRKTLLPIAEANKKKVNAMDAYMEVAAAQGEASGFDYYDDSADKKSTVLDAADAIIDIREYDVPYHVRVSIDKSEVPFPRVDNRMLTMRF
jgi:DNA polymerase epsilon subunit 1